MALLLSLSLWSVPAAAQFYAYVPTHKSNSVSVINTSTRSVIAVIPVGVEPLEAARGSHEGCQPASHVGTTEGTICVPDRSKRYRMLPNASRKFLTILFLQICQGSGVGSIPIGRSIRFIPYNN